MDNHQQGPPGCADALQDVIERASYKPGWRVWLANMDRVGEHLHGSKGLTLNVTLEALDSSKASGTVQLHHYFAVPPAAYGRETWERWLLDCLIQVETHEALEWFKVDGQAPFFPAHGRQNGHNPYTISRRHAGDNLPGAPVWVE